MIAYPRPSTISKAEFETEISEANATASEFLDNATLTLWAAMNGTIAGYAAAPEQVTNTGILLTAIHALQQAYADRDPDDLETLVAFARQDLTTLIQDCTDGASRGVAYDARDLLDETWWVDGEFVGA